MKTDNIGCLLYIICTAMAIILAVLMFKWIWNSDLPEWAKWLLLR